MRNPERKFCADCTPEYQRKMIAADRCTRPQTKFFLLAPPVGDDEPSMVGMSPGMVRLMRRLKRLRSAALQETPE